MKEKMNEKDAPRRQRMPGGEEPSAPPVRGKGKKDLMEDLRSQTPGARRRITRDTDPDEPGMKRRTTAHARYRFRAEDEDTGKKKKNEKKPVGSRGLPSGRQPSLLGGRILLVLLCYLILMPLSLGGFYLWLSFGSLRDPGSYLYQYKENDKVISGESVEKKTVCTGSTFYLNVTEIARRYGMITTGDSGHIRYLSPETGESVEFCIGTCLTYVNEIPERMEANSYAVGETVYAPLSFVSGYFSGMSVELDRENRKIVLSRTSDENGVFPPLTFGYRQADTTSAILFSEVDERTRNEILAREELRRQLELEELNRRLTGGNDDAEP